MIKKSIFVVMLVGSLSVGNCMASGFSDIPLTSATLSSDYIDVNVVVEIHPKDKRISKIALSWGGVLIEVPEAEFRDIDNARLGSVRLLGRTQDGSFTKDKLAEIVVSLDFGRSVEHIDNGEGIAVCGHVRFHFSGKSFSSRYTAIPSEGPENKWRLFEKLGLGVEKSQGDYIGVWHPWLK